MENLTHPWIFWEHDESKDKPETGKLFCRNYQNRRGVATPRPSPAVPRPAFLASPPLPLDSIPPRPLPWSWSLLLFCLSP
uniref:Uncharacterized protein n=1 Tax=Physcomitrium patens TaxID=3218 RepID=A0A2K1J1U1_PHYPA|nr:hypothetical protein PHYPA_023393 [Physcomitrium patens]